MTEAADVRRLAEVDMHTLTQLWADYGLRLVRVGPDEPIPGSFWGDSEAGLMDGRLYARLETPVHSIVHEGGHFVCMDGARRAGLDTDAGGGYDEENGVCYLQILLANGLPGMGRERMCADMDAWGYTFRLGSAAAWFRNDAEDARDWLRAHGIIDKCDRPTGRVRP